MWNYTIPYKFIKRLKLFRFVLAFNGKIVNKLMKLDKM